METTPEFTAHTRVLGIWAHPDDEAYLSAGLMLRAVRAGASVTCVSLTAGEQGTDDPERWPPARLAERRRLEFGAAMAAVLVDDGRILDFPDGGCEDIDDRIGIACVADLLEEIDPTIVVTFGPDGMTGHPDHRTVSRWVTRAWAEHAGRSRLWLATKTPEFAARFRDVHDDHGVFPPGYPVVTPASQLALELTLDADELEHKRAALAAHASQTEALAQAMGEETYRRWWDTESFRPLGPMDLWAFDVRSATSSDRERAFAAVS